jgi:predicted nucleotidyltransferase
MSSLLFKDYRRKVLGLLLLHPDESYYVREIARLTGTVAGTLHRELARLSEAGVLVKEEKGNQVLYRANRSCLVFEELASILRKTSGVAEVLADALASLADRIDVALVFGSIARGSEHASSDIDLLVIGNIKFADVVKAIYPAQEDLGREINPKVYSRAEWQSLLKQKGAFVKEIMDDKKLFVLGDADDLR